MYELIHEKLQIFHDLGIIRHNDHRIRNIQNALAHKNEIQIDNWAHDIIVGNKTLDEALYGGEI
jgi:hypothetical protein